MQYIDFEARGWKKEKRKVHRKQDGKPWKHVEKHPIP